jgi:hypothetical protein
MERTTSVPRCRQSDAVDDPLTELAREGARRILAEALVAEAASFVAAVAGERLEDGRRRVAHHGSGPERTIQTGAGPIGVRRPKVRDRDTAAGEKLRLPSAIRPRRARRARRTRSLDALLPVLHLRGVSTGDVREALAATLGKGAPNLLPDAIAPDTRPTRAGPSAGRPSTRPGSGAPSRRGATPASGRMASTGRRGWSRRPSAGW